MTGPVLFTGGQALRLGKQIGKGGEGTVYLIEGRPGEALKHYTLADLATRSAKVEAMVRAGLAQKSSLVSYPSAIATDSKGQFAGFVMRLVSGYQPIHNLYTPFTRKANFPDADFRFLVAAALNVACAVAEVHSRNCVIGDINHSGFLVSDKAIVALIDADSFQIVENGREHLCVVGVPEFTPPELQGQSLSGVRRTPNHDAFGLAVMLFQLFGMGKHPYSGTYTGSSDISLDQAIREHRFAYSLKRSGGTKPPPGSIGLKDLTPPVAAAFEAAFDPSAVRPTAAQWVELLREFGRQLRGCAKNPVHIYSETASVCPWCRIEAERPVTLFLPKMPQPSPSVLKQGVAFDLQSAWAAIRAVTLPSNIAPAPLLPQFDFDISDEAIAAARRIGRRRLGGGVCIAVALGASILAPSGIVWWLMLGGFGIFLGVRATKDGTAFKARRATAQQHWNRVLADWEKRCGAPEVHANRATLEAQYHEYQALPKDRRAAHADYDANRKSIQHRAWLEGHSVRGAKIPGIGRGRQETLVAFGIETAWDVNMGDVLRADGFGQVRATALVAWRQVIASRFSYDPRPNAQDAQVRARIDAQFDQRAGQLRNNLAGGAQALHTATRTVLARWQTVDQLVVRAYHDHARAQVDADHVNASVLQQIKRISTLGWCALIMGLIGLLALIAHMPDTRSKPVPQQMAQPAEPKIEPFASPKAYRANAPGSAGQINIRQSPSGDAPVIGHLEMGSDIMATGRATAADGSAWIVIQRKGGATGYVSKALLKQMGDQKPVAAADQCTSKPWVEALLCSNSDLRSLDDQLNETYRRVRRAAPSAQRTYLLVSQRDWLSTRAACEHKADPAICLQASYRSRIDELDKFASGTNDVTPVAPPPPVLQAPPPQAPAAPAGPILRGDPSSLITPDDYPPAALRADEEGRVTVRLHVQPQGSVDSCEVIVSSGFGDLDQTTCRLMIRRARYVSVRDPSGYPVGAFSNQTVNWTIPRY